MSRLSRSFSFALHGIYRSIQDGANMRIHLAAAAAATFMGFIVHLTRVEWALLSITIFMVLAAEVINTAIERTVDFIGAKPHPLAKLAKDLAAGGVLLTAINAIVMAGLLFGPFLIGLLHNGGINL